MTKAIGVDSILINRRRPGETVSYFKSLVGISVYTDDYEDFKDKYSKAIESALIRSGISRDRSIYCNYDLKTFHDTYNVAIHEYFFDKIKKHISEIHISYTVINKDAVMFAYGQREKELKHKLSKSDLDFDEILNKLNPYFPLISVWTQGKTLTQSQNEIFIDGVTVPKFEGFKRIQNLPLNIFFSGDKCNPLISTADILLYLLDLRLRKYKLLYKPENFSKALPEIADKVRVHPIGTSVFKYISPLDNSPININSYLKHPMIFLFRENSPNVTAEALESTRGFQKIYDFAFKKDGSFKFYNKNEDKGRILDGDYLVYLDEKSKNDANVFKRINKNINVISFEEIPEY